jgi:hypothetical protein
MVVRTHKNAVARLAINGANSEAINAPYVIRQCSRSRSCACVNAKTGDYQMTISEVILRLRAAGHINVSPSRIDLFCGRGVDVPAWAANHIAN